MNISLLKRVDCILGWVAAAILPAAVTEPSPLPRRVLLIRPGGIGDAVLLIPAILALREKFPEAEISVLAERRNASAFALCPAIERVLLYDNPCQLVAAVRAGYDLVIDTEQWHRLSAVVTRLIRAPLSIGFATNNRKRLFSHRIEYSHDDYERESFLSLLKPLGITAPASSHVPFLTVPAEAQSGAARLLAPTAGKAFVTLFPGASIPERRWGAERFREVAQELVLDGVAVVVVGGKDDAEEGDLIASGCGGLNLAGRTSLAETAAVIERSLLVLSGDSGVLHVAVGLGVPTVSLFGPGIEAKWGPKGEGDLVLNRNLPCSPCTRFGTTPPCPIGARCLSEITTQEVTGAVRGLLAARRPPGPEGCSRVP